MTNNYFKLGKSETYFFDENNPQSVRAAWAQVGGKSCAVYRPIPVPGPWQQLDNFVGHRKAVDILADIAAAEEALGHDMDGKFDAAWRGVLAARTGELTSHPSCGTVSG